MSDEDYWKDGDGDIRYKQWVNIICPSCDGIGYCLGGRPQWNMPDDCGECTFCNGGGNYWITPNGRLIEYPGGRFMGVAGRFEAGMLYEKRVISFEDTAKMMRLRPNEAAEYLLIRKGRYRFDVGRLETLEHVAKVGGGY